MRWQNPDAFWTLVCLIPLSMLLIWAFAKRLQSLHLFAQKALWKRLLPQYNPLRRAVKLFLILCAFVALLIALARPQFGFRDEEIEMTGLDVMLVLDVSLSMDAQDVIPSRIAKAKHWLKRFVNSLASDRVGLILFAQSSFVDCPLTPDLNYVRARIEAANTGSVQVQGTNIGNGLKTALFALQKGAEQEIGAQKNLSHVVLLLSDGEDHDSQALAQAKEFQEKGIKLIVVGIGTPEGGKIPLQDATGNTVFLKDAKGKVVTTKFDKTFLNKLAETAGSQYFDLTESGNAALLQITQDLGLLGGSDNKIHKTIRVYNERFQVPVGIGLGLLLFEFAIGLLPLGLFRRVFKNKKALALFWLSLAVPMNAAFATSAQAPPLQAAPEAAPPPPQPTRAKTIKTYRLNRRGLQELQAQQFEDALQDFGEAQVDDPDVEELDFNQGLAMAGANQHTEAIKKFEKTRESHNPRMQLESQYELGHVYAARKSYNQAVIEYAKALALAKLYNQPDLEQQIRVNIELMGKKEKEKKDPKNKSKDSNSKNSDSPEDQKNNKDENPEKNKDSQNPNKDDKNDSKSDQKPGESKDSDKKDSDKESDKSDKSDDAGKSKESSQNQNEQKEEEPQPQESPKSDEADKSAQGRSRGQKQNFESENYDAQDINQVMSELADREKSLKAKLQNAAPKTRASDKPW